MLYQWYLFVLLIAVALFSSASQQTYTIGINGRQEQRYGWIPALAIAIPLILLAGTRPSTIGDTAAYLVGFKNTPSSLAELPSAISSAHKDKGFVVLTAAIKILIGNHERIYLTLIAMVSLLCVIYVYRKHSSNFIMSLFLFIASGDYIQWSYNGIRQFLAVAIIFAATDFLLQKRYLAFFAVVLVMSTIHASALIMIPICLIVQGRAWNTRTVLFTLAALIAINFSGTLRSIITGFMTDTQYSGEVNQFLETKGTNIFRVLVFCIPPVFALLCKPHLDWANTPILNLAANMSIISMGTYIISAVTSGIFIGRIPIYFSLYNYILLPWLVENVFEEKSKRLVYIIIIACYMFFYYYQMHITWNF